MKKKTFDLTTDKGIEKSLLQLEADCLNAFIDAGLTICPFAIARIDDRNIIIGIIEADKSSSYFGHSAFGSEITIYSKRDDEDVFIKQENSINFGTCGSFTPKQKESYWRTIHAASVISNWEVACNIVNEFCAKKVALNEQIREARTKTEITQN